ncbi:PP2C family protein-serine/threonine phosphatase [Streptomyces flavofungini]|uniref:PP2C family protein-serine/threonine phosphatase n=1 Tax=Streptomyces flavofungini TaxID=68200 RepID=UPI0025B266DD|nr:PP2C family protein-serine/threonine phosphatase [Streptomyces flavofungini]WJV49881.1 PP2C family protein-serine/threonine phosphatase [Streptomyces flavofungini]
MNRIKPRAPRRGFGAHHTARRRARTAHGDRPGATTSFERPRTRRLRRALTLGLPTLWGAAAITYKLTCPLAQQHSLGARIVTSAVFFAVGTGLVLQVRHALLRELRQLREVAGAAQNVLLRPLPPRVDGFALAAGRLSATHGASVGGDLYEVAATDHGVRLVMGDVRGHGLAAIGTAAAVLGSFREAAHEEPELPLVLRRLERALARHLRERSRAEHPASGAAPPEGPLAEEFVTVLLVEIGPDGDVRALNCGHPWPYRLRGRAEPMPGGDPLPPLGPFPLPADLPPARLGRLLPGDALALYTDGMEDARDTAGRFFPLQSVLTEAARTAPVSPQRVIHAVYGELLRHIGRLTSDDAALLVLRNDRSRVPSQVTETGRRARTMS